MHEKEIWRIYLPTHPILNFQSALNGRRFEECRVLGVVSIL
jgi:hypothetical protein